ncbi:MAG: SPASM domain-containing protein [Pseudomonadales bacterium]
MTAKTLTDTIRFVKELAEREHHDSVNIIYHGGEPLTLSEDRLRATSDMIRGALGHLELIEFVQSSFIPYRTSHGRFIKERCGGVVGASVDFKYRQIGGSNTVYLDLFMAKVKQARKEGLIVNPCMVPSIAELGKEKSIIDWFAANQFDTFFIERFNHFGDSLERPTNAEQSEFMIRLFECSMDRLVSGLPLPRNNVIAASLNGVLYGEPGERWGGNCQKDFIVVNPDGALNTCPDRIEWEKDAGWPNTSEGVKTFQSSPIRLMWISEQAVTHKEPHCHECRYKTWCKSGCPITPNKPTGAEGECSGYQRYLNHVSDFVSTHHGHSLATAYLNNSMVLHKQWGGKHPGVMAHA